MLDEVATNQFTVNFRVENGGGFDRNSIIKNVYDKLGFSEYKFEFDRDNAEERSKAIQSILFYIYCLPDTYAEVRIGGKGGKLLFLADIFGIYDDKYIKATIFSNSINPNFAWDGTGGLTRSKFNDYRKEYGGNIRHNDIRYFLGFCNGGLETHSSDQSTRRAMLQFIWRNLISNLFKNPSLEDLTETNYIM
jgi:hypothetical protein